MLKFPIKYIDDNIIINDKNEVWAYYRIEGITYDFLDFIQKKQPFHRQFTFFTNIGLDLHLLSIPSPTDVKGILNNTMEEMKLKNYTLRDNGLHFMKQVSSTLIERTEENESSEYDDFIGVQLDSSKSHYITANPMLDMINRSIKAIEEFNSAMYNAQDFNPETDILVDVINSFKTQARIIENSIRTAFSSENSRIYKAKTYELIRIIEKVYSVKNNNSDVKVRRNFKMGEEYTTVDSKGNQVKAIRTDKADFVELQNTTINPYVNPKYLHLSKINHRAKVDELFVQYFVISEMENINFHPGFEWLHYIKRGIGFPVSVSIRVDNMPNEMIKKRLSNVKLEIKDQKIEAYKGGEITDDIVDEASAGVRKMEKYFQTTGYPSHVCSFVIKITGESEEQLKTRGNTLKDYFAKFGIKIVAPYGEQTKLMYETLVGSSKLLEDYKIEVESGVLAGMMFGTSTNIGDNRGFYIGYTTDYRKPVFVQPDLAAKAFEGLGNVVNSLSVLVAGMTGKGKSFLMNLFIYLSVLTGSRVLIVDPKGDRKGWANGLPFISKEELEVWTLGEKKEDAGSLDPFRTSASREDGVELALDILSLLTGVTTDSLGYGILTEAVFKIAEEDDPCIGSLIQYLRDLYKHKPDNMTQNIYNALEGVVTTLTALESQPLSSLLFGQKNQNYRKLDYNKIIQVLMIQNLNLANENKDNDKLLPSEKISEAIMTSITAWTKQYMLKHERSVHKIILQDEASAVERNQTGSNLMDFIVRQGRYYNTTLLKGSQNASDHDRDVSNMGMKFSFALRKKDEAEEMLKYLNLPITEENVKKLINLDKGECLFQDIYGRTAKIKIDPIFVDLYNAFDTSTSTEEERERERNRS